MNNTTETPDEPIRSTLVYCPRCGASWEEPFETHPQKCWLAR